MLPSASDAATSISRSISRLAAVDSYKKILNNALLMGGEQIRGTHNAPLGHVAVYTDGSSSFTKIRHCWWHRSNVMVLRGYIIQDLNTTAEQPAAVSRRRRDTKS